jgi:hypothetical protein
VDRVPALSEGQCWASARRQRRPFFAERDRAKPRCGHDDMSLACIDLRSLILLLSLPVVAMADGAVQTWCSSDAEIMLLSSHHVTMHK